MKALNLYNLSIMLLLSEQFQEEFGSIQPRFIKRRQSVCIQ
jgi:hypothetical protein